MMTAYKNLGFDIKDYPNAYAHFANEITLPLHTQLTDDDIKYVTEKRDGVDEVIGRSGGLNIRDDEFIVYASSNVIFRCKLDDLKLWELLSKDGVVITGPDIESGGQERTIIAFYVYHRR